MSNAIWLQDSFTLTPLKVYQVPIVPDCGTFETLGAIRAVGDGAYEWWRWESRFYPEWPSGHGFTGNEFEAMTKVLEGWE
jgi:hypothetical protein